MDYRLECLYNIYEFRNFFGIDTVFKCNDVVQLVKQLYSFGETVSIVMWTDTWQPDSYFDKIQSNKSRGLHTLCLLGK